MKIHVFAIAIIFMMLPSKIASQNNCLTIINDSTISITTVDTIQKDSSGIYNLYRSHIDSLNFYKIVRDKKISKPQKIYVSSNDTSFTWGTASLSFPDKISSRFFTIGKDSVSIVWGIDSLTLCIAPNFISNVNPNDSIAVTGSEVNLDEENKLGILLWILSGFVLFLLVVVLICRKKCGKGLGVSSSGDNPGKNEAFDYKEIEDELYYNLACRNLIECKYEDAKKCVEKLSSDSLKKTLNKELKKNFKNKGEDKSDGKNISIPCLNLFENPRSDEYESLKNFKEGIIKYVFSGQENDSDIGDIKLEDVLSKLDNRSNTQDEYVSAEETNIKDETNQQSFEGNKTDSETIKITENKSSLEYDFKNDLKNALCLELSDLIKKSISECESLSSLLIEVDRLFGSTYYMEQVCKKPNKDQKTILNGYLKNACAEPNEDQKNILDAYLKNVCAEPNEDQKNILDAYLKNVCKKPNENQRAILILYVKDTLKDWFSVDLASCKSSDYIKDRYVLKLSKDWEGYCIEQLNAKLNDGRKYRSIDELVNDCLNSNNEKQTNVIEFDTAKSSKNGDSGNLSGNVDNVNINIVQSDVIKNIANVISDIFKENSEFKSKLDQICNSKTIDEFNSDLTSLLRPIVAVLNSLKEYGSDAEKIKSGILQETVSDIACFISESFKDNHEINDKVQKIYESKDLNELKSNLKELLNSLIEELQNEKKRIDYLTSEVDKSYNDLFKKDIEAAKPHIEQFITEAKNVINTIRKDNEEINNMCESYKVGFYECINSTFDGIVASISEVGTDTYDTEETKKIVKIFREKVQDDSSLNNLKNKLKEICDNAGDYGKFKAEVIELFKDLLGKNCWIHALTKMYLYVQHTEIAKMFEETGLSVSEIDRAFILTEHLLRLVGIELEYPQLFKDSFDVNRYESRSLNDIVEIVGNTLFKELLCNRQDTIIDLHRVGFKVEDKEEKKPVVSNYS